MMTNERRYRNFMVAGALTLAALLLAGTPHLQAGQVDETTAPAPEDEKPRSIKQMEAEYETKMREQELKFEMARKELEMQAALMDQQLQQQLEVGVMKGLEHLFSDWPGAMQRISEMIENEANLPSTDYGDSPPDEASIDPFNLLYAMRGFNLDDLDRDFLKDELPEGLEIINELEANPEEEFNEIRNDLTMQLARGIRELKELKPHEPAEYAKRKKLLDLEVAAQLIDLRSVISSRHLAEAADPAEREAMKRELHELLEQAFDAHEKRRVYEAQLIEHELKEIRSLLEKRASHRDRIIQQRMQTLTGEGDELSW